MRRFLSVLPPIVLLGLLIFGAPVSGDELRSAHFLIIHPPEDGPLAEAIASSLERARETLQVELGVSHGRPLRIKLVPVVDGVSMGRYLPDRRTMEVLTGDAMRRDAGGKAPPWRLLEGVLWHEYVHFLQHRAMERFIKRRDALWFIEGTAECLGRLRFMPAPRPETVWNEGRAVLSRGRLPTLEDLNRYHQTNQYPILTYFFSADAVEFLIHGWGMGSLRGVTRDLGKGVGLSQCLVKDLGVDLRTFEAEWHRSLEKRYRRSIRDS